MSASAPQLPMLSPSPTTKLSATVTDFKTQALEKQMANRERRMRQATEAPRRKEFLNSLLNQDLQQLSKWHGSRPHHEQKRFVRAVDSIYKGFGKIDGALPALQARRDKEIIAAQEQQAAAYAQAQAIANRDDPYLRESPRGPAMVQSSSTPNLPTKPIDVFEAAKKKNRRRSGGGSAAGSDTASMASGVSGSKNGLEKWMDCQSTTTATTNASSMTQMTTLSQMTRTSSGGLSDCSEPGTHNQMIYRVHKRALAANKRTFNAKDQHAPAYLKDGIPNIGFPECERMATQYRDQYGYSGGVGGNSLPRAAYASVFNEDKLPFVDEFLESAPTDQTKQVAGMVRSLNYLRLAHHRNTSSVMTQDIDLKENSRLWVPKMVPPMFDPSQRNLSKVPLGAIGLAGQDETKRIVETPPPSRTGLSVYSPSVSGLGSLPLTPRSLPSSCGLPTPMAGGRDLPMASAPTLATIAELG